jgi:hypothetical protein
MMMKAIAVVLAVASLCLIDNQHVVAAESDDVSFSAAKKYLNDKAAMSKLYLDHVSQRPQGAEAWTI